MLRPSGVVVGGRVSIGDEVRCVMPRRWAMVGEVGSPGRSAFLRASLFRYAGVICKFLLKVIHYKYVMLVEN